MLDDYGGSLFDKTHTSLLRHDFPRAFVIPEVDEFGMAQVIISGPFRNAICATRSGLQPDAVFHLFLGQ
jgi:hypothetical protein